MAIGVPDNFSYGGKKANFDRDQFTTLAEMRAYSPDFLDEGHISYCKEDKKHYKWTGTEWEEFQSGGGGGYEPPVGGIPKTDLAEDVQISLGKADTALQEHQSLAEYAKKSEVPTKTSQLTNDEGFLTEVPDGVVSEKKLSSEVLEKLNSRGGETEISDGSVTTNKIANGAITEEKLSQGVKDKLNSTGGGGGADTSMYKISLPANFGVQAKKRGLATSKDYYNFGNMPIINLVAKFLKSGNIYSEKGGEILSLRKDADNYLGINVKGYNLVFSLVINKTTVGSVSYGQTDAIWKALINTYSWVITIDSILKKIVVTTKNYVGTTYNSTFVIDISDWELDLLGEFQVVTEIGKMYVPILGSKFFVFNNYINVGDYLDTKLMADNYSPFAVSSLGSAIELNNLTVKVGGVRVETISPTHVIHSYSQASKGYFALGCSASGFGGGSYMATRVRFTDITVDTKIYPGTSKFNVFDDNLNYIGCYSNVNPFFTPESDKWYIMVANVTDRGVAYAADYAYSVEGAGTVEVQALYVSYEQSASLGSLNWDGEYFTGYIPFKGEKIEFEKITDASFPPLYELRVNNGIIQMWDGSAWKQISN